MDKNRGFNPPDTYLILFWVAVAAWVATWLVPAGRFTEVNGSISLETYEAVARMPALLFASGEERGFLNLLFEGLVSGDRYSATVGLMAFLLIVGGAFGVIMRTGAMEVALRRLLGTPGASGDWMAPGLFVLFSLAGAVFGMGEEAIVFVMILAPAFVRAGYDSLTALIATYLATQVGFATSWMNPFSVVIAQGIAGLPIMSGAPLRLGMWAVFTLVGASFCFWHARRVRLSPHASRSWQTDRNFLHSHTDELPEAPAFGIGHALILLIVFGGVAWIGWGVAVHQYYFPEIASQFFAMGLAAAIVGSLFKLDGMDLNAAASAFREGAMQLAPAAIIVGIAKGIVFLMGGDDATSPSVLNTALYGLANLTGGLPEHVSAASLFMVQSVVNLFVVSGSGQAALTMPLMAPLAELNGLSRQIAVLAFQLGDGLVNILCPASAALMGSLAAARVEWTTWLGFIWKFMLLLMGMALGFMLLAVSIGYQ